MAPPEPQDDFYSVASPRAEADLSYLTQLLRGITGVSSTVWITLIVALTLPFIFTRLTSEKRAEVARDGKRAGGIWRLPYWIPYYGRSLLL